MGIQVTISANQIDKERLGYCAISMTHFTDTAEPSIAAGSKVEIGGALYEFTGDETGTGWGGVAVSNIAYFLLTPSGASVAWSYTTTAPTWDTAKQGWYTGANRVFGFLWKDSGGNYEKKTILGTLTSQMGKLRHLPLDNTLTTNIGTVASVTTGWAGPFTGTGSYGVPTIAKAIRVTIPLAIKAAAAGVCYEFVSFSDNNSSTPAATAHPYVSLQIKMVTIHDIASASFQIDIPLNNSGQFYTYVSNTNVEAGTVGACYVNGYYIGD